MAARWNAGRGEGVVLLGGRAGERMEPVTEVSTMVASNIPNHGTIEITRIRRG